MAAKYGIEIYQNLRCPSYKDRTGIYMNYRDFDRYIKVSKCSRPDHRVLRGERTIDNEREIMLVP